MKVTKEIISALKNSESFVVKITFNGSEYEEKYSGTLTCIEREKKKKNGWIKPEVEHIFDLGHCWFNSLTPEYAIWKSFCAVSLFRYGVWQLLSNICKEGDEIIFWASVNNNQYMKACETLPGSLENLPHDSYSGLNMDCLWCTIQRGNKIIAEQILVEYSICPDNSARMFRR